MENSLTHDRKQNIKKILSYYTVQNSFSTKHLLRLFTFHIVTLTLNIIPLHGKHPYNKTYTQQKHDARIVFCENKLCHPRPLFDH